MIPRRCPKCQRLIDESEIHATDPSVNPLWAVPDLDDAETHSTPAGPNGVAGALRHPAPDAAPHGAVPAT